MTRIIIAHWVYFGSPYSRRDSLTFGFVLGVLVIFFQVRWGLFWDPLLIEAPTYTSKVPKIMAFIPT